MGPAALFIAVFLACVVEAVEATTIVLAAGTARHWRSALTGVAAGLIVLAVVVGIAGPAIQLLPLGVLRLVVGGLLLVFGLQWVRKAILRASGYKPLHDEDVIFQENLEQARAAVRRSRFGVADWYAFTLSFKGVLLEGLEVAFIVVTFGTNQHHLGLAALAAGGAIVLVVVIGVAVRAPLARIPENTLKFVVGVMLTSFGIFWGAEGAGADWPGADLALLVIAPGIALVALAITGVLRARHVRHGRADIDPLTDEAGPVPANPPRPGAAVVTGQAEVGPALTTTRPRTQLKAFGLFWYDFVIGDDWRVAAGVAAAFALTYLLSATHLSSWWLLPATVVFLLPFSVWRAVRSR